MAGWTTNDIPPQTGTVAVVTGATGGLGYETALALARAGAAVIVAGRNEEKGREAIQKIEAQIPHAAVTFMRIDLADMASVAAFADRLAADHPVVDLLVNNAGVMALPTRETTADGFEMQFGTNYLGHFALTAHLLPLLRRSTRPRIVSLSSVAHRRGTIDFDDLQAGRAYRPWKAYNQSKLAMLIFARELQRRSDAEGWGLRSNAAHPGWARTDLIANGPGASGSRALVRGADLVAHLFGQSAADGALPTLYAATAPDAHGGAYYGPDGIGEAKGSPTPAKVAAQANDRAVAARLWGISERLTGVAFGAQPASERTTGEHQAHASEATAG